MKDYEKKYKEALSRAATELETCGADKSLRNMIYAIFPDEIKESEDEKIRKALVRFHKSTIDIDGIKGADILAWLEKQGSNSVKWQKNTPHNKPAINHSVLMKTTQGIAEGEWQGEEWFQYRWSWTLKDSDVLAWMELSNLDEQGEQKPAVVDFNAKDWYVSKVDGKIHDMTYNPADKVEPKFKVKYAGSEYNVLEVKDIAGVTFYGIEDEPNHIDYVKAENCEIISGYALKENGSPYPTKPSMFSEQKPAWSEEDKDFMYDTISNLTELKDRYGDGYGNVGKCIDWLKSLKNRIGG